MSTAGSDPNGGAGAPPPSESPPPDARTPEPAAPAAEPPHAERARHIAIFRWRGIIPLVLLVALISIVYILFIDRIVESTIEEGGTKLLGTAVEVDGLRIRTRETAVEIGSFRIADPFNRMRNLIEAGQIRASLMPEPLIEKKVVVQRLSIRDVRFGNARSRPAPQVTGGGFAPRVLRAIQEWSSQFKQPILSFTPIDTIRAIALDPTKLNTVRTATTLAARTDSVKTALEGGFKSLGIQQTLDSAEAVANRLKGANPLKLGIDGTRKAVADIKHTIDNINAAKQRLDALERNTRTGVTLLASGVRSLDGARRQDYAFARSLLKLPSLEGPQIGEAMFGKVSIDRFQQAMYWAEVARHYMPPGLLPREDPGPKRLRMAGSTVRFPEKAERVYPSFQLQAGDVSFTLPQALGRASYIARLTNISSAPALTGAPTRVDVRPTGDASGVAVRASAELDHTTARLRDQLAATVTGVKLPGFNLPALPARVEPGRGQTALRFLLDGNNLDARWSIRSSEVSWLADSAKLRTLGTVESIAWRVVSGLRALDVTAQLTGDLRHPELSVSSNIDQAVAAQLKKVFGEEVAKGEAKARAAVDKIVQERVAPVQARVVMVQTEAQQRVEDAKRRLDEVKQRLEDELKG
jgi:uncharacterized protein (TIGR03545 family)